MKALEGWSRQALELSTGAAHRIGKKLLEVTHVRRLQESKRSHAHRLVFSFSYRQSTPRSRREKELLYDPSRKGLLPHLSASVERRRPLSSHMTVSSNIWPCSSAFVMRRTFVSASCT